MNPQTFKRIRNELQQHKNDTEKWYVTSADPQNLTNVHFTFLGPQDSPFQGGLYHGIIMLNDQYPMRAPNIQFSFNNGRFEQGTNICTTFTAYHQESWLPSWNIKNIILALRSLFTEETPTAIGSVFCADDMRKELATKSLSYKCKVCGCDHSSLQLSDQLTNTQDQSNSQEKTVEQIKIEQIQTKQQLKNSVNDKLNQVENLSPPNICVSLLNQNIENTSNQNYIYALMSAKRIIMNCQK